MEVWLGMCLGIMTGMGMASVHPAMNPGRWIAAAVGLLGGMVGAAWWGDFLSRHLADHSYAGAAVGGALGGAVLALVGGIALALWRRTLRPDPPHGDPHAR